VGRMKEVFVLTLCISFINIFIWLGEEMIYWFRDTENIIEKIAYINFFIYLITGIFLCILKIGEVLGIWKL
jgi:hypothetical protein